MRQYYQHLPGHSVIHHGVKDFHQYIRKVMDRVTRFLRRKEIDISVDNTGFSTSNLLSSHPRIEKIPRSPEG